MNQFERIRSLCDEFVKVFEGKDLSDVESPYNISKIGGGNFIVYSFGNRIQYTDFVTDNFKRIEFVTDDKETYVVSLNGNKIRLTPHKKDVEFKVYPLPLEVVANEFERIIKQLKAGKLESKIRLKYY